MQDQTIDFAVGLIVVLGVMVAVSVVGLFVSGLIRIGMWIADELDRRRQ